MTLRWAILGTSFISHTVAAAIAGSEGSVAMVVAGRNADRLRAFQNQYGIAHAVASVEEAVAHREVDAVYIGLPNHVHHTAVMAAASAGKAILSEKSLTVTRNQATQLLDAVRERVFFVEGLMYLAHPLIPRFTDVLTDGRLGELRAVHASYSANIAHLVNPSGRGAIFNLGCYPMSLTQLVIDLLEGEGAFATAAISGFGRVVDGNVCDTTALVRTNGGTLASVHTSETCGMAWNFAVQGTNGTLRFLSNPWLPGRGTNTFEWAPYEGAVETFTVHDPLDAFDHQIRLVERAVANGQLEVLRPSPRLDDSRALLDALVNWESRAKAE